MKQLSLFIAAVLLGAASFAQTYQERAQAYIAKYKDLAISEQQRTGVPAAIKLGQGILETNAGSSELSVNARNHFGIKCKSSWTGQTYSYTDDAPDECFRKYDQDMESYRDHSDFLKNNKRYASCFQLEQTNYKGWARELRKCGYATNPRYADQLIKVIEDFQLQDMTYAALNPQPKQGVVLASASPVPVAEPKPAITLNAEQPAQVTGGNDTVKFPAKPLPYGLRMTLNGLDGFYARKGELLLESAIKFNVRYARLLEMNDLEDAPLPADMFIYLEKKKSSGARAIHIAAPGETMLMIAQAEGMQLKALRRYNQMEQNEEPAAGAVLQLQQPAQVKPATANYVYEAPKPAIASTDNNMIAGGKKPEPPAMPTAPVRETPQVLPVTTEPASAPLPATTTQQHLRVNIADEQAVEERDETPVAATEAELEETDEEDEEQVVETSTAAAPAPAVPMSDFDLLKAKMDKAVYAQPAAGNTPKAATSAAAPAASNTTTLKYHVVAAGETAFSIARKYGITMKQLIDWNQLDFGKIKTGQQLRVK